MFPISFPPLALSPLSPRLTPSAFINAHTVVDPNVSVHEECPICLENYTDEKCVRVTNISGCMHRIGLACLQKILNTQPHLEKRCPLCRTVLIAASSTYANDGSPLLRGLVRADQVPTEGYLSARTSLMSQVSARNTFLEAQRVSARNSNLAGRSIGPSDRREELFPRGRQQARRLAPDNQDSDIETEIQDFNEFTRAVESVRSRARETQTLSRGFGFMLPLPRLQGSVSGAGPAGSGQEPAVRDRPHRLDGDSTPSTAGAPPPPERLPSLLFPPLDLWQNDRMTSEERLNELEAQARNPPRAIVRPLHDPWHGARNILNDSRSDRPSNNNRSVTSEARPRSRLRSPTAFPRATYIDLTHDSEPPRVQARVPDESPGDEQLVRNQELNVRAIRLDMRTRDVENRQCRVNQRADMMHAHRREIEELIKKQMEELEKMVEKRRR